MLLYGMTGASINPAGYEANTLSKSARLGSGWGNIVRDLDCSRTTPDCMEPFSGRALRVG